MKRKTCKQLKMLAVAMTMGVCSVAHAQQKSNDIDWTKDFTSRITLNGYAQGGWSYQDPNGKPQNAYNLKRTLCGLRPVLPTDGRLCLCTTSRVWFKSIIPTTA